jgi:hypothetical protein
MDNAQSYDSYINILSLQTYRFAFKIFVKQSVLSRNAENEDFNLTLCKGLSHVKFN